MADISVVDADEGIVEGEAVLTLSGLGVPSSVPSFVPSFESSKCSPSAFIPSSSSFSLDLRFLSVFSSLPVPAMATEESDEQVTQSVSAGSKFGSSFGLSPTKMTRGGG